MLVIYSQGYAETEYEKGWDHFKSGNYSIAKKIWLPLAAQGDGDAALGLAIIYENGLQTAKNPKEATSWYQIAADAGVAEAQHDLGIKYFTGSDVVKDHSRAYKLWKQAAETGLGAAQTKLAYLYLQGLGTKKDEKEALRWYRQAASQGNTEGMYNLSLMYKRGTSVPVNTHQFHHWLKQAAEQNYAPAQYDLGLMMLYGKDMERSVPDGKNWLIKSANNGSANAQYYLGTLYMNGHILRADRENATKLLTAAAKQGHKGAKQALIDLKQLKISDSGRSRSDKTLTASSSSKQTGKITKISKPVADPKTLVLNESLADTTAAKSRTTPVPKASNDQTSWLLQQNADKFTIQLIASQDKVSVKRYLKKLPKNIEPFTYQFHKDNKAWVAVATGIYADHGAASRAIKSLPAKVRKSGPWIRNIGLLQDIITQQ